jgi:hypothetical protein
MRINRMILIRQLIDEALVVEPNVALEALLSSARAQIVNAIEKVQP